jgi:hypothetical protein
VNAGVDETVVVKIDRYVAHAKNLWILKSRRLIVASRSSKRVEAGARHMPFVLICAKWVKVTSIICGPRE